MKPSAIPLSFGPLLPISQAEGRRFEPGLALQVSRAPSRCYAMGLSACGDGGELGAAGVPFGVAEVEIGFFFAHGVCVDSEGQLGVCVTESINAYSGKSIQISVSLVIN